MEKGRITSSGNMEEVKEEVSCGSPANTGSTVSLPWSQRQQQSKDSRQSSAELGSHYNSEENFTVDCKDKEVDLMVKNELEELLGLQVQFGESHALPVDCPEPSVRKEKRISRCQTRKALTGRHLAQVDIGGEAFKMWSDVGTSQGLGSDPEIAAFLLHHYENTKDAILPNSKCSVCDKPLLLFCSQCNLSASFQPQSSPATPSLQQTTESGVKEELVVEDMMKQADTAACRKGGRRKQRTQEDSTASAFQCSSVDKENLDSEDMMNVVGDDDDGDDEETMDYRIEEAVECVDDIPSDLCQAKKAELSTDKNKKRERTFTNGKRTVTRPVTVLGGGEGSVFKCKVCNHSYTRACSLKAHMRKHTGEKPFKCTRCDAAFSLSGSLIIHNRTHTGDKPYVCEDCGHSFPISSALKQHRRQHTGEKPYHCKICFSKYSRSDSLKVHMRTHSGDRPFICEECGADFSRLYCLIAHKKKHSGERPFQCQECEATFTQSGKLTIHMRKHTGDRPFQCEQCGASFTQSDRLKIHLRIHSGEKPYKCGECGKGFSHPHSLKVHSRVHTGDRPYKCEVCSLTFADPSYFRRHKAKHTTSAADSVAMYARNTSVSDSIGGSFKDPISSTDDFTDPMSSAGEYSVLQSSDTDLATTDTAAVMTVGFPRASSSDTGRQRCFSLNSAEQSSVPSSSCVPSLGFSMSSSTSLEFPLPSTSSALNQVSDGPDTASSDATADPFSFLSPALHCPDGYPS